MIEKLKQNKLAYRRWRLILLVTGCLFLCWGAYQSWGYFFSNAGVPLKFRTVQQANLGTVL